MCVCVCVCVRVFGFSYANILRGQLTEPVSYKWSQRPDVYIWGQRME